jgi:hypothetical protein
VKKFLAEEKVAPESAGLRSPVCRAAARGSAASLNIEEQPGADDVVVESAGVRPSWTSSAGNTSTAR